MKQKLEVDHSKISRAGQHLLNIFYAIIFLIIFSLSIFFVIFFNISGYQDLIFVIGAVQLIIAVIILSNLYSAGKNLKNSAMIITGNKMTPAADKIDQDEFTENLVKNKADKNIVLVENKCPACSHEINSDTVNCPNCGLNFN